MHNILRNTKNSLGVKDENIKLLTDEKATFIGINKVLRNG